MKKSIFFITAFLMAASLFAQTFTRELKLEQRQLFGDDVVYVQQKLRSLGIDEVGKPDGWFDDKTLDGVETFQHFFGFEVNGIVNQELFDYLGTYESEPGLGNYIAAVKKACHLKYTKHHLIKKLDDCELTSGGGYISAYYNNKNGGIIPSYAIQHLYGDSGHQKNVYYPLSKQSYIYTGLNETSDLKAEYFCYYVEDNKHYLLKNGKLEDCGITEHISVNPARIYSRLKEGR